MTITILFADNLREFTDIRAEYLEDAGYRVIRAYTPEEAARAMDENYVQLAILDIRLRDDDDVDDISGITLAKNPQYSYVPKIILTNWPAYQTVSEIFNKTPAGLPPFVNYIKKDAGLEAMLDAIQNAIDEHIHLNDQLAILWDEDRLLSFPGLVGKIEHELPPELLSHRVQELQALFQKLFFNAEQITITQQFWLREGRVGIEVRSYAHGKEQPFFVTVGLREPTAREKDNYVKDAPEAYKASKLALYEHRQDSHYAATAWSILANRQNVEDLSNFSGFYPLHTEKQTRQILDDFYKDTYAGWVIQGRYRDDRPLDQIYRSAFGMDADSLPYEKFLERMEALSRECMLRGQPEAALDDGDLQITFQNGHKLRTKNPLPYLSGRKALPAIQALMGLSFGGLEPDALLVDRLGFTWLTDFGELGNAPVWLDAASLEYQIRLKLIAAKDLQELHDMEKIFLEARRLGENVPVDEAGAEYKKPAGCIQAIRQQVAETCGDDLAPYEMSLFFLAGQDLAAHNPALRKKSSEAEGLLYRLLLAGLICEKLTAFKEELPVEQPVSPFSKGIYIDEDNHEAWVGERLVNLTQREYELLVYLYHHPGELCKRQQIMHEVFNLENANRSDEENLLNTNISRLRKKIEPDPDHPIFLLTNRGVGFKLILKPE